MQLATWHKWTRPIKSARLRKLYRRSPLPYWFSRYLWADKRAADYGILSLDPPIFYVPYWVNERLVLHQSLAPLFDFLANTRAYFLYCWLWDIQEPQRVEVVKRFERYHRLRYPKHQFLHLCNTTQQLDAFSGHGMNAIFSNHNAFVDERIFHPLPGIPRIWDAVYDARFKDYKRHELAAQVSSLALIYDVNPVIDDPAHVERVRRQLAHAHFFNHDENGLYHKLTTEQVNLSLNRCHVGMCLSAIEGGNYASIQYLLCGMPVVSTRSRGGRDVFFDDDYVAIVDDTPDAVREGVESMLKRPVAPQTVRARTLEKRELHRRALIDCVQKIYEAEGVARDFASEWDGVFFNKLVRHQPHAETFARIESARRTKAANS